MPFFIAASTVSGLIGSSRTRAPVAANTAFATAGAAGGTPGSPMPPRAVSALDDMHVHLGRLAHPQEFIVREVLRLDAAVRDLDLLLERRAKGPW